MENKQESRIEILDRLSKKWGSKHNIQTFDEFCMFYDSKEITTLVYLAMAEYERQTIRTMYSKSQVIKLINKFNDEVTIGGKSELKDKYMGELTYPEIQQKWIEENILNC